jgi:hypothetical protein
MERPVIGAGLVAREGLSPVPMRLFLFFSFTLRMSTELQKERWEEEIEGKGRIFNYFKRGFRFLFCDFAILRFCDFAILRFCDFAILRFCDFAILRFCDFAIVRLLACSIVRLFDCSLFRYRDLRFRKTYTSGKSVWTLASAVIEESPPVSRRRLRGVGASRSSGSGGWCRGLGASRSSGSWDVLRRERCSEDVELRNKIS